MRHGDPLKGAISLSLSVPAPSEPFPQLSLSHALPLCVLSPVLAHSHDCSPHQSSLSLLVPAAGR